MALPDLSGNPEQGTPCVGPRIVACLGNALGVFGKNRLVTPPSRDSVKNYTQLQEKHLDNLGSLKTNNLLQFLQKKLLGGDFFDKNNIFVIGEFLFFAYKIKNRLIKINKSSLCKPMTFSFPQLLN